MPAFKPETAPAPSNLLDSMLPPAIRGGLLDERLGRVQTRCNEFGYDPFGFSRRDVRFALRLAGWLYHSYFRVEVHGAERVPPGRVLLVSNHSGQLPFDALAIITALFLETEPPRLCRAMVE